MSIPSLSLTHVIIAVSPLSQFCSSRRTAGPKLWKMQLKLNLKPFDFVSTQNSKKKGHCSTQQSKQRILQCTQQSSLRTTRQRAEQATKLLRMKVKRSFSRINARIILENQPYPHMGKSMPNIWSS
ncbi:uncharacterized protein LOC133305972 [Gastrolobium bilobum]|uniref:uncharacterized protein LOC133305972 n=1 Tax=Gastrolobium bilobum TaxID=150636 RepID=UPI002AB19363|nr:uncharacterized protein LOC133305972 [Gastrolobium bilobum]